MSDDNRIGKTDLPASILATIRRAPRPLGDDRMARCAHEWVNGLCWRCKAEWTPAHDAPEAHEGDDNIGDPRPGAADVT